ncbi:MAG: zinc-dependent metalloprotease, partial [Cytophagales bacterium]
KIVNGKIDLSEAYDTKIGAFDKVSIAYGYQDFPAGTDEEKALTSIIQQSLKEGLTFLSDQDARPQGGAHPYAHLWDNGNNPVDELNHVMEIRKIALSNLGERSIQVGAPMATLEEVLVPMYFFHRYQAEAAVKMIGGLNYRYALRGDGQPVTQLLTAEQEQKALDALLKTIEPSALMLPESLLKIIPPRPLGYNRHRELVKIKTELTFDPLAAAETAADMTFGLILNPARANRLVEHNLRDNKLPALATVIDKMVNATIKSSPLSGMQGGIQMGTNLALVNNLAKLLVDDETSVQVKGIVKQRLGQLQLWLAAKPADEHWKGHYHYLASVIDQVKDEPNEFKSEKILSAPPGMPIGQDDAAWCNFYRLIHR